MKNLIIPIDHLVMLAELDDKEAGQMAKAIAQYANKGIAPRNQYDQCHGQEVGCKEEGCQESNCD